MLTLATARRNTEGLTIFFGGIALDSDFAFEQLEDQNDRTPRMQLTLRRGGLSSLEAQAAREDVVHRARGRYSLTLSKVRRDPTSGLGQQWVFRSCFPDVFLFDPASHRIDCHIASTDDRVWQDVLLRRVIPRIATTYGALAIHAAAVAIEDRCLLLLGQSGAGKSTLTAFCAQAGWRALSEDTTLIWPDDRAGTGFMVEPVQRGIGVWGATREALALADCTPMPGYDGCKYWFDPPADASAATHPDARSDPRPLSGVLILERSADVTAPVLTRISRGEALRTLLGQAISFLPSERPGAASAALFGRIAALYANVPCFRLFYPDGYAQLPQTERLLRAMSIVEPA
jgi:hypothetical protein